MKFSRFFHIPNHRSMPNRESIIQILKLTPEIFTDESDWGKYVLVENLWSPLPRPGSFPSVYYHITVTLYPTTQEDKVNNSRTWHGFWYIHVLLESMPPLLSCSQSLWRFSRASLCQWICSGCFPWAQPLLRLHCFSQASLSMWVHKCLPGSAYPSSFGHKFILILSPVLYSRHLGLHSCQHSSAVIHKVLLFLF